MFRILLLIFLVGFALVPAAPLHVLSSLLAFLRLLERGRVLVQRPLPIELVLRGLSFALLAILMIVCTHCLLYKI